MGVFIGTDIEEVSRFRNISTKKPIILKKLFYPSEFEYAQQKSNPYTSLTGIWCAKEAIVKAFSPCQHILVSEVEIIRINGVIPGYKIHNSSLATMDFQLSVSISHTKKYATSTAILIVDDKKCK